LLYQRFAHFLSRLASTICCLGTGLRNLLAKLSQAQTKRGDLGELTTAYRIVNGAGDRLPGIEVDAYGAYAVCSLHEELRQQQHQILDAVFALGFTGVYLKLRPKRAHTLVATRRDEVAPSTAARGENAPCPLVVQEWEVPYLSRLGDGLSTGLFLDQRDARGWLQRNSRGKSVLNLFCYHAAFTVAAVHGGATKSVSIDSSRAALLRAQEGLDHIGASEEHRLSKSDAQQWLQRGKESFDIVLLDPPSYSSTKRGRFRADKDYPQLAAAALKRTEDGGILLACTNHRGISPKRFDELLRQAAKVAKVSLKPIDRLPDPCDFPPEKGHTSHLKRCLWQVTR
jgi:23S rRNA (cytosine1962-C5)-methyltransferase